MNKPSRVSACLLLVFLAAGMGVAQERSSDESPPPDPPLACSMALPPGASPGSIRIELEVRRKRLVTLDRVESEADCLNAAGGWYLSADQTEIILCPSTCNEVKKGEWDEINVIISEESTDETVPVQR